MAKMDFTDEQRWVRTVRRGKAPLQRDSQRFADMSEGCGERVNDALETKVTEKVAPGLLWLCHL